MRNTFALAFVSAACFALGGCAADTTEESTDSTQQATVVDDRGHLALGTTNQAALGATGGPAIADNLTRRMYDFDPTPRFGARVPYTVDYNQLNNVSIIPHSGSVSGQDIALGHDSNLGVGGPK